MSSSGASSEGGSIAIALRCRSLGAGGGPADGAAPSALPIPVPAVPLDTVITKPTLPASSTPRLPQRNVNDVVSSLNNPSRFDPPHQLTESEAASPGFKAHPGGGGAAGANPAK